MKKILFLLIALLISISAFSQTKYYVKNGGNNTLDGLTDATAWANIGKVDTAIVAGDSVFFKRGSTWREQLIPISGSLGHSTYYGAYGTGEKPKLYGSREMNDVGDWTEISTNVWKCDTTFAVDIGNIIFNNEASIGVKCMTATPLPDSLDAQGDFWYSFTGDTLILYSVGNPANVYTDIELALTQNVVRIYSDRHHLTFQNLDVRYAGQHGIAGTGGHSYINVLDCDISYIGGGDQVEGGVPYTTRYGNGIEFWAGLNNLIIERCIIGYCYDAGITTQGYGSAFTLSNNHIRYNIIRYCEYGLEMFYGINSVVENLFYQNNTIIYSGYGPFHNQRPDGVSGCAFRLSSMSGTVTNVCIRNNIFYEATERLFYAVYASSYGYLAKVTLDYNLYYTTSGNIARYGTNTYNNIADWRTASNKETNAIESNPLFLGGAFPISYKLQSGSPARDVGLSVGLTSDYFGGTVPVGPLPDIGFFEYGSDVDPPDWHPTGLGWDDIFYNVNVRGEFNFTKSPTIAGAPLELASLLPSGLIATTGNLNATAGAISNFQGQINEKLAAADTIHLSARIDLKADTVDQAFTGATTISDLRVGNILSNTIASVDSTSVYAAIGTTTLVDFMAADTAFRYIPVNMRVEGLALADSTGVLQGSYVTGKALVDSLAAFGGGLSAGDVAAQINDTIVARLSAATPGIAIADTVHTSGKHYFYTQWQVDSLAATIGGGVSIGDVRDEIADSLNAARIADSDTIPVFIFGAGAGLAADTALFNNGALIGSFYNSSSDTLHATEIRAILKAGTGTETIAIQIHWGATFLTSAGHLDDPLTVNSHTTDIVDTSFDHNDIPPGVWVWGILSGASSGNKPTYICVTLTGYKRNRTY